MTKGKQAQYIQSKEPENPTSQLTNFKSSPSRLRSPQYAKTAEQKGSKNLPRTPQKRRRIVNKNKKSQNNCAKGLCRYIHSLLVLTYIKSPSSSSSRLINIASAKCNPPKQLRKNENQKNSVPVMQSECLPPIRTHVSKDTLRVRKKKIPMFPNNDSKNKRTFQRKLPSLEARRDETRRDESGCAGSAVMPS